jgi:3D (Asp-Asp-Asp) domain-containing protein
MKKDLARKIRLWALVRGSGLKRCFLFCLRGTRALLLFIILIASNVHAETDLWKVTSYCSCKQCCGPNAKGITASGKKVKQGMIACNWLPFGTKVSIEGLGTFTVEDRGAKSLFGSKKKHIKHIDVYLASHRDARKFGVKWLEVKILK